MTEETGQINKVFYSSKMVGCIAKQAKEILAKRGLFLRKNDLHELTLEMRQRVLDKASVYDASISNPFTYAIGIVNKQMTKWLRQEAKYRQSSQTVLYARARSYDHAYNERRRAKVRRTVARLSKSSREMCELIMRYGTLESVREALKMTKWYFYEKAWPACREEFKRAYSRA